MASYFDNHNVEFILVDGVTSTYNQGIAYFPFTILINPVNVKFTNKIKSIEYDWGDGEVDFVDFFPSTEINNRLPFPFEIGNPLNYTKQHTYNFNGVYQYEVKVNFILFGDDTKYTYSVNLNLSLPTIESLSSYLSGLNLIKTRMYGPNNTLLYVFQGLTNDVNNKDVILMATTDWSPKQTAAISPVKTLSRPYKFVSSIENAFTSFVPENSAIRIVPYGKAPYNPDNGVI